MLNRQNIIIAVLALFAVFNLGKWALHFSKTHYQPIDFRTYYLGAKAYFNGANPYDDSTQAVLWQENRTSERFTWNKPTGFPHATVVYTPQFAWYFYPYQLMDFTMAKWMQLGLNILSLVLIMFSLHRLRRHTPLILVVCAILAFRGTWYSLDTGQPMIQVLACCMMAIYLADRREMQVLPALLMAMVSFKFTVVLPFIFFLFLNKRYSVMYLYAIATLIFNIAAVAYAAHPYTMLDTWQQNANALWDYTHAHGSLNGLNTIATSITTVAGYYAVIPPMTLKITGLALLIMGLLVSWWIGVKKSASAGLVLFFLSSLCMGHHLIYDLLVFVCLCLLSRRTALFDNAFFYLLALMLLMPVGTIADYMHYGALNFILPLTLTLYLLYLLYACFFNRNIATKKPS